MKDDASIVAKMEDDIRRLKGRPDPEPGFQPIGAGIYDLTYNDAGPWYGDIRWTVDDVSIFDDQASFSIRSGEEAPPSYLTTFFNYIWYDDGFAAEDFTFTVPEDGVYAVHARVMFGPSPVLSITLSISFNPLHGSTIYLAEKRDLGYYQMENSWGGSTPGEFPNLFLPNFTSIEANGFGYIDAGCEVHLDLDVDVATPPGASGTDTIFRLRRSATAYPPPIEVPLYSGPTNNTFFVIQKIGNKPDGGAI